MRVIHRSEDAITEKELLDFINKHRVKVKRYEELRDQYESRPPILEQPDKDSWKPDNRLVVNFARNLVATFNGYFTGIPIKITHENEVIDDALNNFWQRNNLDDGLSELSKMASIYGVSYLYMWQDENAETRVTYNSPMDMFIIYDDSIEENAKYGVRYRTVDGMNEGELITDSEYIYFTQNKGGIVFTEQAPHFYPTLPIIEFVENEEQQSLIEPVETLINAYNNALSEKANDVNYFADAYLSILGAELDESGASKIRDNRIINIFGTDDASKLLVEFLDKPEGDITQENLMNRIERLIYQISMIANISDESYGNASGVALEFKLQPMKHIAGTKEQKFKRSLNRMFQNFLGLPTNIPSTYQEEWSNIGYDFTRNMPRNIKDEATTARELEGVVSQETKLSVLSIVPNIKEELARMEEENKLPDYDTGQLETE